MFSKLQEIWDNYGFEILFGLCILFILVLAIFNRNKKGTWSSWFFYNKKNKKDNRDDNQPFYQSLPKDSKGETASRQILEKLFNKPFPKERPDFLRNPVTGGDYNLELDCFNRQLKIALEYHGAQHYKYIPYFHRNKEAFYNQKYRDEMKRTKCRENGILLIEVPYTVKEHQLEEFIINELKVNGVKLK